MSTATKCNPILFKAIPLKNTEHFLYAQWGPFLVFQQRQSQNMANNVAEGRGAARSADPLSLAGCRGEAAGSGSRDGLTPLNHKSAPPPLPQSSISGDTGRPIFGGGFAGVPH